MSKKEKVSIVRSDDFEEVDAALNEALVSLEAANGRVAELLESEVPGQLSEAAELKIAGDAGAEDTADSGEETDGGGRES